MESLNQSLFFWLNASSPPNPRVTLFAIICAQWLIWSVPCLIGYGWLKGHEKSKKAMLVITVAGLLGLLINQSIGLFWMHPRPFMIGMGHTLIPSADDSSFPSDHLTLWWTVAFSLLFQPNFRHAGIILILTGIPVAWARVYLGVHFPFDMLGAMIVAICSAWLSLRSSPRYLPFLYPLTLRMHRRLFAAPIRRGWLKG